MDEKIGIRIKEIRKHYSGTQDVFANELAISQTHVSKMEKGNENPSATLVRLISILYNINEDWIWTGKGDMIPDTKLAKANIQQHLKCCHYCDKGEFVVKLIEENDELKRLLKCAVDDIDYISSKVNNCKENLDMYKDILDSD